MSKLILPHIMVSKCYYIYQRSGSLLYIGEMNQETNCPIITINALSCTWGVEWGFVVVRLEICGMSYFHTNFYKDHGSIRKPDEIYD